MQGHSCRVTVAVTVTVTVTVRVRVKVRVRVRVRVRVEVRITPALSTDSKPMCSFLLFEHARYPHIDFKLFLLRHTQLT